MCNSKCYDTISIIVSLVLGVIFAILRVHTPFYVMSGCCDTGWGNLFFTKCKKRLTTACRGVYYSINDML